jgi:manganese/iron transport system substrate-binding protein
VVHRWSMIAVIVSCLLSLVAPALVGAQATERTFPETGFSVRGPFLRYWEANGGLAQQGYPISNELTENGLTVQYFERARFEYHPGNAPEYQVLLGLIGRDFYQQRYPVGIFTPPTAPAAALPGGNWRLFPQTGKSVPPIFLSAWERFGGLAQQGYPVSEVFREGPYYVQYFERARFEYHPEFAGTSNEVLLGLLGKLAHGQRYGTPRAAVATTTSISILADLIKNVGGERVSVTPLVPAGEEPHEFEPAPQDAVAVAGSSVFFANGLNLEEWLEDLIRNAASPNLRVVTLSQGLPVLGRDSQNPEYAQGNPHLWLDVTNAMAYVMTIRDTLTEIDPANGPTYDGNAARYLGLLDRLDTAVAAQMASIPPPNRKLVTFHDAWPYFAARYGLKNLPVLQANPEAEPSAQEYAELVEMIRREQPRAIFGEAGFNPKLVSQLARDTGVRFVDGLHGDTLAESGLASTYVGMMQFDISLIANSLR